MPNYDYDFRVLIDTTNGDKKSYGTSSFVSADGAEPILSSYVPKTKHPTIPDKLIKTPRKSIWDSVKPNRKEANILAKAKILITALLKKK